MDRILKGILQYRQTFRKSMVEEFKRVADRPEVIIIIVRAINHFLIMF